MALQITEASEDARALQWVTRRGQTRTFAIPNGWLTVDEADALPAPDTSWMTNPIDRGEKLRWLRSDETSPPIRW